MRHDAVTSGVLAPVAERALLLNHQYRHHSATSVLTDALNDPAVGRVALVSSFGAESVVLLHLLSVIKPDTPVLFVDTQMLFAETLAYQEELARSLKLTDIRTIFPDPVRANFDDPDGTLHQFSTDACCALRKTVPLEKALGGFDAWITGRKRFQGTTRSAIDFFEAEGDARLKIKISGCINACGHHHVGHIGILGLDRAGVENYQITLGGDGTETAVVGERAGPGFAYDEIVPAVERLVRAYLDARQSPDETFLEAYRRLGLGPFKAALYPEDAARHAA